MYRNVLDSTNFFVIEYGAKLRAKKHPSAPRAFPWGTVMVLVMGGLAFAGHWITR